MVFDSAVHYFDVLLELFEGRYNMISSTAPSENLFPTLDGSVRCKALCQYVGVGLRFAALQLCGVAALQSCTLQYVEEENTFWSDTLAIFHEHSRPHPVVTNAFPRE